VLQIRTIVQNPDASRTFLTSLPVALLRNCCGSNNFRSWQGNCYISPRNCVIEHMWNPTRSAFRNAVSSLRISVFAIATLFSLTGAEQAQAAGPASATLQINVWVAQVLTSPRPREATNAPITFTLTSASKIVATREEKPMSAATKGHKDRIVTQVLRTVTYTIR
jgi:hypothetical protein